MPSVPDTTTFNMDDVKTAVGNYNNLYDLFKFADSAQFDPAYAGNKDNLLNFRNYGNQRVWRLANAYGVVSTPSFKFCNQTPNTTIYWFGVNSTCINIGDLICSNNTGTRCRIGKGYYYTPICYGEWILVDYDSSISSFFVKDRGFCTPP
tara:strand:- start:3189 stop:3638 length:450 start_codon:yes stop_codon:yes gene_type:complete